MVLESQDDNTNEQTRAQRRRGDGIEIPHKSIFLEIEYHFLDIRLFCFNLGESYSNMELRMPNYAE